MAGPVPVLSDEAFAAISRAVADPRRFAMLQQIAGESAMHCTHLSVQGCIGAATISHHLKELHSAGLISMERDGRRLRLALRRETWLAYLQRLSAL